MIRVTRLNSIKDNGIVTVLFPEFIYHVKDLLSAFWLFCLIDEISFKLAKNGETE